MYSWWSACNCNADGQCSMHVVGHCVQRIYLPGDNDVGGEMWDDRVPFKVDRFNEYFRKEELVKSKFIDFFTVSVAVVANT